MYCVCLREDGYYVSYFDCDGLVASPEVEDAIFTESDVGCMALIMFLSIFTDSVFDDFYIQYVPEDLCP